MAISFNTDPACLTLGVCPPESSTDTPSEPGFDQAFVGVEVAATSTLLGIALKALPFALPVAAFASATLPAISTGTSSGKTSDGLTAARDGDTYTGPPLRWHEPERPLETIRPFMPTAMPLAKEDAASQTPDASPSADPNQPAQPGVIERPAVPSQEPAQEDTSRMGGHRLSGNTAKPDDDNKPNGKPQTATANAEQTTDAPPADKTDAADKESAPPASPALFDALTRTIEKWEREHNDKAFPLEPRERSRREYLLPRLQRDAELARKPASQLTEQDVRDLELVARQWFESEITRLRGALDEAIDSNDLSDAQRPLVQQTIMGDLQEAEAQRKAVRAQLAEVEIPKPDSLISQAEAEFEKTANTFVQQGDTPAQRDRALNALGSKLIELQDKLRQNGQLTPELDGHINAAIRQISDSRRATRAATQLPTTTTPFKDFVASIFRQVRTGEAPAFAQTAPKPPVEAQPAASKPPRTRTQVPAQPEPPVATRPAARPKKPARAEVEAAPATEKAAPAKTPRKAARQQPEPITDREVNAELKLRKETNRLREAQGLAPLDTRKDAIREHLQDLAAEKKRAQKSLDDLFSGFDSIFGPPPIRRR